MIHQTKGIVLRTVKYGETSVIATIFTDLFGVQSYLVNGVRTSKKTVKAHYFQPASILDLQVYHNEQKNLQRIKEVRWDIIYADIFSSVPKNAVALYVVELLHKCLREPETNEELFHFVVDSLTVLDTATGTTAANFPLYVAVSLPRFFGFQIQNNHSLENPALDLEEGRFIAEDFTRPQTLNTAVSFIISELLQIRNFSQLEELKLNKNQRGEILLFLEKYYQWHLTDFGQMKTLPILKAIF